MRKRLQVEKEYAGLIRSDHLFLDLETLPTDDPRAIAEITERVKAPGSMKKAETIAEWEKNEKPQAILEAISKTSFDGTYGRICCAGWAFGDQPVRSSIGDESEVIQTLYEAIREQHPGVMVRASGGADFVPTHTPLIVIGHNLRGFDLRFLWQRSIIHRIPLPVGVPWHAKQWDDRVQDTMLLWNPDASKRISLGRLCNTLGVQHTEDDFDGSMVASAWARGETGKISRYCRADVEATRECWFRLRS